MSHTFSPEIDRRVEVLAVTCTLGAAVIGVVVFFPAEGHILGPSHAILDALLGHATFVLPLGLGLAGALGFMCRAHPNLVLPRRRLAGLGVITIGLLPADDLLGQSTGLLGQWFTGFLLELLGTPLTVVLTVGLVALGCAMAFDVAPPWRLQRAAS